MYFLGSVYNAQNRINIIFGYCFVKSVEYGLELEKSFGKGHTSVLYNRDKQHTELKLFSERFYTVSAGDIFGYVKRKQLFVKSYRLFF